MNIHFTSARNCLTRKKLIILLVYSSIPLLEDLLFAIFDLNGSGGMTEFCIPSNAVKPTRDQCETAGGTSNSDCQLHECDF